MKKRIAAMFIAPIIGAVLGFLLVMALNNRWFSSKWQMIEKPPGDELHLVALSRDSLWVKSATGTIYYNENSSTCESDCWQEVQEIPALPAVESDETAVTGEACAPAPPLSRVAERISECRRTMWVDYNFIFALRKDGSIYLWQADIANEWIVVLLFMGVCGGAMALFIPTFVAVVFMAFLDRRSHRANQST